MSTYSDLFQESLSLKAAAALDTQQFLQKAACVLGAAVYGNIFVYLLTMCLDSL